MRLLQVPGCPLADGVRVLARDCLREAGLAPVIDDAVGDYPSPTLLVNGVDVVTGAGPAPDACCRLDLPTREQITAALVRTAPAG